MQNREARQPHLGHTRQLKSEHIHAQVLQSERPVHGRLGRFNRWCDREKCFLPGQLVSQEGISSCKQSRSSFSGAVRPATPTCQSKAPRDALTRSERQVIIQPARNTCSQQFLRVGQDPSPR